MSNHHIHAKRLKAPQRGDWYAFWPVWALCGGLVLYFTVALVWQYVAGLPQKSDLSVVVVDGGRDLHLDPGKLGSQQLHLFEARAAGQKVKFVIERTQDKTVHVALASCRTCYRSRERHFTKNGQMMCGECNMPMNFESQSEQASTHRCALVEVPHTETDHDIAVLARDVIAQAATQLR
jgi:uncharacterized membrane protein